MISVIVLHHNKAAYSRACLTSLLDSSFRPLEVINVDNGSRDDTPQVISAWETTAQAKGIATQRLDFETNIGAIAGRNRAMQAAGGDYLVFLDNDTVIGQADWLQRLRDFLQTPAPDEPLRRGIVATKLLFPWQPFSVECCGCGVSRGGRIQYIGRGDEGDRWREPFLIQCAISAAWMMPRVLVEAIGPLDEVYSPVQYEDLDFCYRARQAGWETWVLPAVEVFHFEHTTTAGSDDINFKYVTTRNGLTFKKRWESTFRIENGPSEAEAQWRSLPKHGIEEVDWEQLLPSARAIAHSMEERSQANA